jgi:hypothetical protein
MSGLVSGHETERCDVLNGVRFMEDIYDNSIYFGPK